MIGRNEIQDFGFFTLKIMECLMHGIMLCTKGKFNFLYAFFIVSLSDEGGERDTFGHDTREGDIP